MKMKKRRFLTFALAMAFVLSLFPSVGVKAYDESDEEETVVTAVAPLASVLVTITEPTIGAAASNSIKFDSTLIDAIATGTTPEKAMTLGWVDENGDAFTGSFEEGKSYTFRFMINALWGYSVSDETVAYINSEDNPAEFIGIEEESIDEEYSCVYCVYELEYSFETPATLIESVNLSVTIPDTGTVVAEEEEGYSAIATVALASGQNCALSEGVINGRFIKGMPSGREGFDDAYEGTIEAGKYYYVEFLLVADEGYEFSLDTKVNVTGAVSCAIEEDFSDDDELWVVAKVLAKAPEYTILDGDGSTVTEGSDLVVRASGDLGKLTDLLVDNNSVKDKAELTAGSTIATIKAALLDTLTAGEHTLTFVYTDGEVSTKFTVVKKVAQATVTTTEAPKEEAKNAKTNAASPKTGDAAPLMLASILMLMSFAGVVVLRKRKINN